MQTTLQLSWTVNTRGTSESHNRDFRFFIDLSDSGSYVLTIFRQRKSLNRRIEWRDFLPDRGRP